jgi:hypothetical protein
LGIQYGLPFRYTSKKVVDHFCIPDGADYVDNKTVAQFKQAFYHSSYGAAAAQQVYDVSKSYHVILISAALTVVLGYIYLFII